VLLGKTNGTAAKVHIDTMDFIKVNNRKIHRTSLGSKATGSIRMTKLNTKAKLT